MEVRVVTWTRSCCRLEGGGDSLVYGVEGGGVGEEGGGRGR